MHAGVGGRRYMLTAVSEGHNSMGYANPSPFIQRWPVYNSRKIYVREGEIRDYIRIIY